MSPNRTCLSKMPKFGTAPPQPTTIACCTRSNMAVTGDNIDNIQHSEKIAKFELKALFYCVQIGHVTATYSYSKLISSRISEDALGYGTSTHETVNIVDVMTYHATAVKLIVGKKVSFSHNTKVSSIIVILIYYIIIILIYYYF